MYLQTRCNQYFVMERRYSNSEAITDWLSVGSLGPTFWWETRLAATTCGRLRTCTWVRLQGWSWMTPIPATLDRRRPQ
jgi:hypothetical protein